MRIASINPAEDVSERGTAGTEKGALAWLVLFLATEILAQLALAILPLLIPTVAAAIRVPLRAAAFSASIGLVILLPRSCSKRHRFHPAILAAICAVAFVALGIFHPNSNTLQSRLATVAMYFAIVSPLIWVGRLNVNERVLRIAIIILWSFNSLSALVGTVQTLRPDLLWLQTSISTVVQNHDDGGDAMKVALADGDTVLRPTGLSDQPGAAAMAGLTTIIFGAALIAYKPRWWFWLMVVASMILGLYCILFSQMRSVLVMSAVCMTAFAWVMMCRREWDVLWRVSAALGLAMFVGASWAIMNGGSSITDRLATLLKEDPREIYYQNRGHFLDYTFREVLPQSPLGIGLGRWGMINYYFGSQNDANSEPKWAEIMWTGWVYDGVAPLLFLYAVAIGVAVWQSWKLARRPRDDSSIGLWAAMIFAFNIGCLAMTFNYPLFMGQGGLDFWLLNAVLFAAAQRENDPAEMRIGSIRFPRSATPELVPKSLSGMRA